MQFHEKKNDLFDFTSFFCLDFLKFSGLLCDYNLAIIYKHFYSHIFQERISTKLYHSKEGQFLKISN